ncbi:MAG: polar amino acid transport system substrate-binding protein [Pseudomonadota bacterium]|nr:polar amino acid transport system substrate-binding protein [Pseudomonadota bacterium]MDQ5945310.1 polar amino acid transport system substrate-binding protein [Pseudomonadota bacterium]
MHQPMLALLYRLARYGLLTALLAGSALASSEKEFRVAVIGSSPPMSYIDENGKLTGFNIEMGHALCEAMQTRCDFQLVPLGKVVDTVAAGEMDFAVVSLLATPERRKKVLFSKPYYRSLSIWLGKPELPPGSPKATAAAVTGSAQARYLETVGWKMHAVASHTEIPAALAAGKANAAVVPMLTALPLLHDDSVRSLGLESTILSDPLLTGDVCISINPKRVDLVERINSAIDQIKRDGRFDRINTKFLPFRLQ